MVKLIHKILFNLFKLLLRKKEVALSFRYHDFVVIVNSNPPLPRDNMEYLFSVCFEVVSDNHDAIKKLRLVMRSKNHIVEASKHIFVVLEQTFDEQLS